MKKRPNKSFPKRNPKNNVSHICNENVITENYYRKDMDHTISHNNHYLKTNFDYAASTGSLYKNDIFENCAMYQTDFEFCTFENCKFSSKKKVVSSFNCSDFINAEFTNIKFKACTFTGTLFEKCTFNNVDIQSSTLENALFDNCIFSNMNLSKLTVNLSSIKLNNSKYAKWLYYRTLIKRILNMMLRIIVSSFTVLCVFWIFNIFDNELLIGKKFSYLESITLGAMFSTLGSSLISITSIFIKQCKNNIELNINTLQEDQLERETKWNRWPFVDRVSKHNVCSKKKEYYIYVNPSIKFSNLKKEISIPLSTKDFNELKIIRSYFSLKVKRNSYRKVLAFQPNNNYLKDILIWDCLKDVYKNIIYFKANKMISHIGWSIVISSITLSFFYPNLVSYFNRIILAISTIWS